MKRFFALVLVLMIAFPGSALAVEYGVAAKWAVYCFDATDNSDSTEANTTITASVWEDGVENAVDDTNPTAMARGIYVFDLTTAETDAAYLVMDPTCSTADIECIGMPTATWTDPPNFNDLGIESDGHAHADVKEVGGTAQTANDNGSDINDILTDTGTTLDSLVDDLETRLSATRAGYLDELGPTNLPSDIDAVLLDTGTTLDNYVDELETRLSAARAGYLDELAAANIPADIDALYDASDEWTTATDVNVASMDADAIGVGDIATGAVDADAMDVDGSELTAIDLPNQTMNIAGTLTGNVIGDVTGKVDGTVAGVTPAAVGAEMGLADGAITGDKLAASAGTKLAVADASFEYVTGKTKEDYFQLMHSHHFGVVTVTDNGNGTHTAVYRNVANDGDMVSVTYAFPEGDRTSNATLTPDNE